MHEAFAAALESWPCFLCRGQTVDYLPIYYQQACPADIVNSDGCGARGNC